MSRNDLSATVNPASRRVPEPYLRAEIAAFPLASEESFRARLVELDPKLGEINKTKELWRACESQFAPHTGWSLDRLVAARDRGWFGKKPAGTEKPVPLHAYLRNLARSHLIPRAGVTEIEGEYRTVCTGCYRSLSLAYVYATGGFADVRARGGACTIIR